MPYLVNSALDMSGLLKESIHRLEYELATAQMLILPVTHAETKEDVEKILQSYHWYLPQSRFGKHSGTLALSTYRSALGILDYQDGNGRQTAYYWPAFDCAVEDPEEGKLTRLVHLVGIGTVLVDVEAFAKKIQAPVSCNKFATGTVFVHEITKSKTGDEARYAIVIVCGNRPADIDVSGAAADLLQQYLPSLEKRANSQFDNGGDKLTFHGLKTGWHVQKHPAFGELLGWLRSGYSYVLTYENEQLTLTI